MLEYDWFKDVVPVLQPCGPYVNYFDHLFCFLPLYHSPVYVRIFGYLDKNIWRCSCIYARRKGSISRPKGLRVVTSLVLERWCWDNHPHCTSAMVAETRERYISSPEGSEVIFVHFFGYRLQNSSPYAIGPSSCLLLSVLSCL